MAFTVQGFGRWRSREINEVEPNAMLPLRQSSVTAGLKFTLAQRPFHSSACSRAARMRVIPVPVRKDNYSYLIVDDTSNEGAAVDPYTPSKVKEAADQLGVRVVAGLTTHHHHDHSGGNQVRCVPPLHPRNLISRCPLSSDAVIIPSPSKLGYIACTSIRNSCVYLLTYSNVSFPCRSMNAPTWWWSNRLNCSRAYRCMVGATRAPP